MNETGLMEKAEEISRVADGFSEIATVLAKGVAIDASETVALRGRNDNLDRQIASERKSGAIEKSKLKVALRTLARIKVAVDEIPENELVFDATGVLTQIKEDLSTFCNDDFQRYVIECVADRVRLNSARAAKAGAIASPTPV